MTNEEHVYARAQERAERMAAEIVGAVMGHGANVAPSITGAELGAEGSAPLRAMLGLAFLTLTDNEGGTWLVSVRPATRIPLEDLPLADRDEP